MWMAADFECMNILVDDSPQKTLFINKPVAVGYNIVKNSFYDSLKLENMDKQYFGEDCVECFVNEML